MSDAHTISRVDDCRVITLPRHDDPNGQLTEVEHSSAMPFDPRRVFYLYDVPANSERGGHSHHLDRQLIVAASGSFSVTVDDGARRRTFTLDRPYRGLYIPAGIWRTLDNFSAGSVCLVLTSEKYDEADYVRDYDEFLRLTSGKSYRKYDIPHPFLDLEAANGPYLDEIKEAALRVIDSGRYIGGSEVEALEADMCRLEGAKYAVGVSNGLDALRLIFRAYIEMGRLKPGDEVIVPANTYIASVLAVTDNGLLPVFAEPDPATHNLDTSRLEEAVTDRTRAILAVHLYGRICLDNRLADIAARHSLLIVEDCAQSIGATTSLSATPAATASLSATVPGAFYAPGSARAYSFYPTKNIGALGDAGAVLTDDRELADTVRALANYGSDRRYHNIYAGLNCRLDPIQAAMLRVKLRHIDEETGRRRAIAECYSSHIANPAVTLPDPDPGCVWHQYVVRVKDRDRFRAYLLDNGVGTDVHYATPPHRQPCYSRYANLNLPVTDMLAAEVVSLPIGPPTTVQSARQIADIINRYKP